MKNLVFLSILVFALSGCFHKNPEQPVVEDSNAVVKRSGEDLFNYIGLGEQQNNVAKKKDLENVCTTEPTPIEIGGFVLPTHPDYAHLNFLGELFTAADCGAERVAQVESVVDGMYTADPVVFLNDNPSEEVLATLGEIGFNCADKLSSPCLVWQMEGEVAVEELVKLKPFADEIKRDDCVNCG